MFVCVCVCVCVCVYIYTNIFPLDIHLTTSKFCQNVIYKYRNKIIMYVCIYVCVCVCVCVYACVCTTHIKEHKIH